MESLTVLETEQICDLWRKKIKDIVKISKKFGYPEQTERFWSRQPSEIISLVIETTNSTKFLKKHANKMIKEFKKDLQEDPANFIAAFGIDTWKEVKEMLNKQTDNSVDRTPDR